MKQRLFEALCSITAPVILTCRNGSKTHSFSRAMCRWSTRRAKWVFSFFVAVHFAEADSPQVNASMMYKSAAQRQDMADKEHSQVDERVAQVRCVYLSTCCNVSLLLDHQIEATSVHWRQRWKRFFGRESERHRSVSARSTSQTRHSCIASCETSQYGE